MTAGTTATDRRADWTRELFALLGERAQDAAGARQAIERIRAEARGLGRSKGWQGACEWFEREDKPELPASDAYVLWLAVQSLIWFGREV